jgi:hypothetical protein
VYVEAPEAVNRIGCERFQNMHKGSLANISFKSFPVIRHAPTQYTVKTAIVKIHLRPSFQHIHSPIRQINIREMRGGLRAEPLKICRWGVWREDGTLNHNAGGEAWGEDSSPPPHNEYQDLFSVRHFAKTNTARYTADTEILMLQPPHTLNTCNSTCLHLRKPKRW